MPRKQRFKPSRKPKPIVENTSGMPRDLPAVTIGRSVSADQHHESQPALQLDLHEEDRRKGNVRASVDSSEHESH
jgi:hypothetical protein